MDTTQMMNPYQLAFIDLGFQVIGVFLNLIVFAFQTLLTGVFQNVFGLFMGTPM